MSMNSFKSQTRARIVVRIRRIVYDESIKAGWSEAEALWLCYVHEQD